MMWADYHTKSEVLAIKAKAALQEGDEQQAKDLYAQSAEAETLGLDHIDRSKRRTLGISVVSATALWYKAKQFARAEQIAYTWLSKELPEFAGEQLKGLLQSIWNETVRQKAGVKFAPGQVIVSVKGGEIVTGGAPLDLIVEKVQIVQSLFYRIVEFLDGKPHRVRGVPSHEIQESCRPWLFQTESGSYQFAVAVQESGQQELFPSGRPRTREIASSFLKIVRASVEDPDTSLPQIVPDADYRGTFLKLTRNLAPSGKTFNTTEIRTPEDPEPIRLLPTVRKTLGEALRRQTTRLKEPSELHEETLSGVLRALHLDKDWLEVTVASEHIRVRGVTEQVDDVIGPMVNRPVIVKIVKGPKGQRLFRDIEPAE